MGANFSLLDTITGDRVLNAAAISAILEADPDGLTVAALAFVLAAPGTIGGTTPGAGHFSNLSATGTRSAAPTTVAAAGASFGNAALISASASRVKVTVTASTEGVRLPVITTAMFTAGQEIDVMADPAVGNKVYAATAGRIGANTTATTAYALAKNTVTKFIAADLTHWRIFKGG